MKDGYLQQLQSRSIRMVFSRSYGSLHVENAVNMVMGAISVKGAASSKMLRSETTTNGES